MEAQARVRLRPSDEGGLTEPIPSPCQSFLFRLDDSSTDFGVRIESQSGADLTPGSSHEVALTFWADDPELDRVHPGVGFTLR
jgi:hypothetical protein